MLEIHVSSEVAEDVAGWLVELGAGGVEEQPGAADSRLVTYGEDRTALGGLGQRVRERLRSLGIGARARVRQAPALLSTWDTEWMRYLEPVRISPTLTLVPTTRSGAGSPPRGDVPPGRAVVLEPAMAFGFGEHPTTRLAARILETECRARPTPSVLDLGTGSGVLAIVAAVSGARRVVGLDVEPVAVAAARRNATLNGVARLCRFSVTPLSRVRSKFDVVVANIDARTLAELARPLTRALSVGGVLVLTGLLAEQANDVSARYRELGFRATRTKREGEWVALRFVGRAGSRERRARPATVRRTIRKPRSR